ncbi:MAG: ABC transporter ATP-binding protein [Chloroflexi bacterium]|nr:ABC transporter ATP-binding protein [Chloroflexota bacterium]
MQVPLKQYWDLLIDYLKPQWPKVLLLAILLLSSIGLQLLNPQIMRRFIDSAVSGGSPETLAGAAALFIGVALTNQVLSVVVTYVGQDVGWTATNGLRADLALHCLRLDLSFHHDRTPGEMIERIDGDITALSNFFSQLVIRVLGSGILLVGTLALLFREDWRVGMAVSTFTAAALVILGRTRNLAVPHQRAERQASADLFGFLEERLAGLEDIRANGGGAYVMRRFHQQMRNLFQRGRRAILMRSATWVLTLGLFALGSALTLGMGVSLFLAGAITIGTVYLFFQYTEMLQRPLEQISNQMQELQRATASILRIRELREIRPRIEDAEAAARPSAEHLALSTQHSVLGARLPPGTSVPPGALSVEFQRVSFAYGDDETVLKDVSFALAPGRVLGLLGRTGSGKTTLARLLFRLYDPTGGVIRLGGLATSEARVGDLRRRVGLVTQDVQLFHASVRDNLTFFDRSVADERILKVIGELGLHEWYAARSAGLDTELATGGGGLSAGEAQLLAFIRVFLRDPGLVILDEASSRLDPATERLIEHAVDRLLRDRTVIIIAHRLATVQRADEIVILEQGCVLEQGAREQLAQAPHSRFARLLQAGLEEALA